MVRQALGVHHVQCLCTPIPTAVYLTCKTVPCVHTLAVLGSTHQAAISILRGQCGPQGIRMSSFLETNTGPGQRTLSGFLKKDGADSAAKPAPLPQHGWNQTFLGRETREELAKQFQEARLKQEVDLQAGGLTARVEGAGTAPAAQEAFRDTVGAGAISGSQTEQAGEALAASEVGRTEEPAVQRHEALEPSQATEVASQQPLELTLRDWQPPPASQLARSQPMPSQQAQRAEPFQHSSQSSLRLAPHEHGQSILARESREQQPGQDASSAEGHGRAAEEFGGDLSTCRDVLVTADEAGVPDLAHTWDEEPAGFGDGSEDAGQSASQSAAAKGANGARTWTCQVRLPTLCFLLQPRQSNGACCGMHRSLTHSSQDPRHCLDLHKEPHIQSTS